MMYSSQTKHGSRPDSAGKPVREDGQTIRTMVFDDGDWLDGHLRPEVLAKLSPEERAGIEAAMKDAHDAMARAHMEMKAIPLSAEEQEKVHKQVEDAMKQAHQAMEQAHQSMQLAQSDGRVLMRCKLGPDGKAQDCVKAFPGAPHFELRRMGPDGAPMPPMPPLPPLPPMGGRAPPPPPPPAAG